MASVIRAVVRAARPEFRSKPDRLAFAVHAFILGNGLKLVATGKSADEGAANTDPVTGEEEEVPVDGWQDLLDAYAFRYALDQAGSAPVILKCLVAGSQLLVHAAALGTPGPPSTLEVDVEQYTTASDDLMKGYHDLDGLAAALESGLQPVLKAANLKQTSASTAQSAKNEAPPGNSLQTERQLSNHPNSQEPSMPDPLRDDPLRVGDVRNFPPRMPGIGVGVGADDLMPGGLGMPGMGGGMHSDPMMGGMHMGPNDPMFSGGGLRHPVVGGGTMMHPPGSRYDPIGPPGVPGWNPDDFQRGRMGQGNIHPDIGPPPGMGGPNFDNMFG